MKITKPELPPDTETHYFYHEPVYKRMKKVKVIDRCECCDHKTGEHYEERGVGLIAWKVVKKEKDITYHLRRLYEDRFMYYATQPTFAEKFIGHKNKTKGVKKAST